MKVSAFTVGAARTRRRGRRWEALDGAIIVTSVVAMYAVHALVVRIGPWKTRGAV